MNLNMNDSIKNFSFLNNKIYCKNHKNQIANSVCVDCKTFCCLIENCAQAHIYHKLENLDYLLNNLLLPTISNFFELQANFSKAFTKQKSDINIIKNNLKKFAYEEKKKIDEDYRKILNEIQTIYNAQMEEINDFIENLNAKFDTINSKIEQSGSLANNLAEIRNFLNNKLTASANNSEAFVINIYPDAKNLKEKVNSVKHNKFDFDKQIMEIKVQAEKDYTTMDKREYFAKLIGKIKDDLERAKANRKHEAGKDSLGKLQRKISMRGSVINERDGVGIDMDIFVRYLADTINKMRKDPNEAMKIVNEFLDLDNVNNVSNYDANTSFSFMNSNQLSSKLDVLINYLNLIISNKVTLPPFEWDNDLSNSAEDYFKLTNGKLEKEIELNSHMSEIIKTNYYTNYLAMFALPYSGIPNINKIIISILMNPALYNKNTQNNILFDNSFNLFGIFGGINVNPISPSKREHILLVINFALLNN